MSLAIEWLQYIGSAVFGAFFASAFLAWLVRKLVEQFLHRDLEVHKIRLKQLADLELKTHEAELKRATDLELARIGLESQKQLLAQKAGFDQQMLTFQTRVAAGVAREERVRLEIEHWASPILGAVRGLHDRLGNILDGGAYLALTKATAGEKDANWSIDYEYFFPSTIFLFAQYFCWVRLLRERLRFDLFEGGAAQNRFFDLVDAVGHKLSGYPLAELAAIEAEGGGEDVDCQVFRLQQRAIGEAMVEGDGDNAHCMRFAAFLSSWEDGHFPEKFRALTRLLEDLSPAQRRCWRRLELMSTALEQLEAECVRRLSPSSLPREATATQPAPVEGAAD